MPEAASPAEQGQSPITPPAAAPSPVEPPTPKKIELTEAEITQRVADGIAAEERRRDEAEADQKRKDKEERDREKGEFKALYEAEQQKLADRAAELEALKLEKRRLEVHAMLRDHVAEKGRDYLNSVVDIAPHLKIDAATTDESARKQIEQVFAEFVKRNPRAASGTFLSQRPMSTDRKPSDDRQPEQRVGRFNRAMRSI